MLIRNIKSMSKYIASSWKRRGIRYTLSVAWHEIWFDFRHGTDTIELVPVNEMEGTDQALEADAVHYQATYVHTFWRLMEVLDNSFLSGTFIDMGCGKGRAMMLAAEAGFKTVLGVEFSKGLVDICEQNLAKLSGKYHQKTHFSVTHGDAAQFAIPDNANIVYMANPFSGTILSKVLDNIDASLARMPRDFLIIYMTPIHPDSILQRGYSLKAETRAPSDTITSLAFVKSISGEVA